MEPADDDVNEQSASPIAGYKVLRTLGEGGMGVVYLAEEQRLRRPVALKVIRSGLDAAARARFEYEREYLARMQHPGIAEIFHAGVTSDSRPYFAMEYVQGEWVTTFCDTKKLPLPIRLLVFRQICEAVQHAHQKGIIHRDLKPSNILVTQVGEAVRPKVIDFGVARGTPRGSSSRSRLTAPNQAIGTTPYMSPEQMDGPADGADTRTDVYSLGMVLYELLVGSLPFDSEQYEGSSLQAMKLICEADPPRPSARFAQLKENRQSIAATRSTDVRTLTRVLRRDLDWVVMRSLEKDPNRRYGSPTDLAADLFRWLCHEPVVARPPNTLYRMGKFMRRHRAGIALALMLGVFLVFTAVSSRRHATRLARERDRANAEAHAAAQVATFLTNIFRSPQPSIAQGKEPTVREILSRGASKVQTDLKDQPALQARMMATLGKVYLTLGQYDAAKSQIEGSLQIRRTLPVGPGPDLAESLELLGRLGILSGHSESAEKPLREALSIREKSLGPGAPEVSETLRSLADARWYQDDLDGAQGLYQRALDIQIVRFGADSAPVAKTQKDLADIAFVQGDYRRALPLYQNSLKVFDRTLGPNHPSLTALLTNLGSMLFEIRQFDEARPVLKRALEVSEGTLGPEHPEVAGSLNNYGRMLVHDGDFENARHLFERALALSEKIFGPTHRDVAMSLDNLGLLALAQGQGEKAEWYLERALGIWSQTIGLNHLDAAMTMNRIAILKGQQGDLAGAAVLFKKVLTIRQEKLPALHPEIAATLEDYAEILDAQGLHEDARRNRSLAREIWSALGTLPR